MSSDNDSGLVNRRDVLKTVGAGALASLGAGAASGATPDPAAVDADALREQEAMFSDADSIAAAVDSHATAVLETLVDRGVLTEASAAAFEPARVHADAYADEVMGLHTAAGPTAQIHLQRETDDATVDLYVRPGDEVAEASVRLGEESGFTVESDGDDVTVQGDCWTSYTCYDNYPCYDGGCIYEKTVCCDPGPIGGPCCECDSEVVGCCGCY